MAAIQTLLVPALEFRSCLDLAASRLLSPTVWSRTIAHPSGRQMFFRWSHSDGPTVASEDNSGSPNGRYASTSKRSTTRPAFGAERQPLPGGRPRTVLARRNPTPSDYAAARQTKPHQIPRRLVIASRCRTTALLRHQRVQSPLAVRQPTSLGLLRPSARRLVRRRRMPRPQGCPVGGRRTKTLIVMVGCTGGGCAARQRNPCWRARARARTSGRVRHVRTYGGLSDRS